jgi:integrase
MLAELKKWRLKSFYSQDQDLVFPNSKGNPLGTSDTLRKHFFPALKAAELPKIRFHDLRHTFASHLLDQGENVIYVSQQLGHSSPVITLQVYSHLIRPDHPQAALKLEEKIFQKSGSKAVADAEQRVTRQGKNKS